MATTIKGKSKTELLGYVPLEKRIAQLQVAGLRTKLARDEHYDTLVDKAELPAPPLLPRHFEADMAEVSQLNRIYQDRRADINERIRLQLEARKLAAQQRVGSPEASQASGAEPPSDSAAATK